MSKGGFEFDSDKPRFGGKLALSSLKHLRTESLMSVPATKHLRQIRVFRGAPSLIKVNKNSYEKHQGDASAFRAGSQTVSTKFNLQENVAQLILIASYGIA